MGRQKNPNHKIRIHPIPVEKLNSKFLCLLSIKKKKIFMMETLASRMK